MQLKKWFVLLLTVAVGSVVFAMPVPSGDNGEVVTVEKATAAFVSIREMVQAPTPEDAIIPEDDLNTNLDEMAEAFLKRAFKKDSVTDEDCDQFIKQERGKEIEANFQAGKISELTHDQEIYNLYRSSFTKEDLKINVKKNLLISLLEAYVKKGSLSEEDAKRAYAIYVAFEEMRAEAQNSVPDED